MIDAILTNTLLPDVSRAFLNHMLGGSSIQKVDVQVSHGAFSYLFN